MLEPGQRDKSRTGFSQQGGRWLIVGRVPVNAQLFHGGEVVKGVAVQAVGLDVPNAVALMIHISKLAVSIYFISSEGDDFKASLIAAARGVAKKEIGIRGIQAHVGKLEVIGGR